MQRFNIDEQIASLDQQIIATQASIPLVVGEMEEVQKEIDTVQIKMMNATTTTTTTITNAAVTSEKQMDRWAEDKRQLAEDIEQLEDYKKQLHEREKQLRVERLAWMTYAANLAQTNKRHWNLSKVQDLQRRSHCVDPAANTNTSTPVEFLGRAAACDVIGKVVTSNFFNRASIYHGGFSFLVVSGHILSGKTRTGRETPRLVDEMCAELTLHAYTEVNFVNAVYLKIDFMNDARFNPQFDVKEMDVSVTLGSRLMNAFYNHEVLKEIEHDKALHHIITTVLANAGETDNSNTVVPIVIHFDEHVRFIQAMDKDRGKPVGKYFFEDLLRMIGSAATSESSPLSDLRAQGRYFIVGITTGTSFKDASFRTSGQYAVHHIPLPVLDGPNTKQLAIELLKLYHPKWSDEQLDKIMSDVLFQVALADTAGLPGLIHFLCETSLDASYVEYLHFRLMEYMTTHERSYQCWDSLTTIAFARPRLVDTSVIEGTYTVRDALDSGTVLYDKIECEIRLAPVLLALYNTAEPPTFHSLVLKLLKPSILCATEWTLQDVGKSHAHYLAATLMALQNEKRRFDNHMTLGTLLRHVEPQRNAHLEQRLLLSSEQKFNGITFVTDTYQCISISPGKKKRKRHGVHSEGETSVLLTAPGTKPLIDAYLKLQLVRSDPSGQEFEIPTTLFLQYNNSVNTEASQQIKVSVMNAHVQKLTKTLAEMGWDNTQNWLILCVSNRPILVDVIPHSKLLWVGKDNLEQHAPLIARRGQVIQEHHAADALVVS